MVKKGKLFYRVTARKFIRGFLQNKEGMNFYFAKRVKGYEKFSGMNDKVIAPT
jgi:hypothetical protein